MAVVSRLCSKMEPADACLPICVESLSGLLQHEDQLVADGALKCFASLADRYIRKGVDPAPLAENGLTAELLERLANAAAPRGGGGGGGGNHNTSGLGSGTPGGGSSGGVVSAALDSSASKSSSQSVSTTISLLSTLCRGSPSITHNLLRASLPEAIEAALGGDERCVLDTMRLTDLLLVLLFEGRSALPKASTLAASAAPLVGRGVGIAAGLRRMDSAGEKTHRQLIDCIRSKDTDALIEAVESGQVGT